MALKRLHFDLRGAADYFGVSLSDVEYYIKEGDLRYGIEKFYFSKMKLVPLKRLDATQQQSILDNQGAYYQTAFVVSSKKARSSNNEFADGSGEEIPGKISRDKNKQPNSLPKT